MTTQGVARRLPAPARTTLHALLGGHGVGIGIKLVAPMHAPPSGDCDDLDAAALILIVCNAISNVATPKMPYRRCGRT
jgi:hypothetical protein